MRSQHYKNPRPCPYTRLCFQKQKNGFTFIELIISIAVLTVIGAISVSLIPLQKTPQLVNASEEIMSMLRLAQNKTLSSEGDSQYGVYFNTLALPHQYILFKGSSYALRDSAYDQIFSISGNLEFYEVNTGSSSQIVFDKLTGSTANSGNVSLRFKDDYSQTKIIYIDNSGVVSFTPIIVPSDSARIKDSRHISFNYVRNITTLSENIVLTFDGGTVVTTLPINLYLNNGQFDWTGTITVSGSNQTVRIHTIRLNNPDTQFSIYRDRRFNDKSLTVKLSGDATGSLVEYTADGLTTLHPSIYVDPSSFTWQ